MKTSVVLHQKYLRIHYHKNGRRIRISTGVRIEDKSQFQNGKIKKNVPDSAKIQLIINLKQNEIEELITDYFFRYRRYPTTDELRSLILQTRENTVAQDHDKPNRSPFLLDHFRSFLKAKESDFSINGKRPSSIKDYRNVFVYLEDYERFLKRRIRLDYINKIWLNGFVKFLETERKSRRYHQHRGKLVGKTVKKRIVMFLSFFRWLEAENIFPFPHNIRGYSKHIKDSPTVKTTFSKAEVKKIYEYKTCSEQHDFVRDVFVFSCYTGFRWSDLITINKKHFKEIDGIGSVIEKDTIKTNEKVIIPLNSVALQILTKWDFNFNRYPNATFNKALKTFLHSTGYFENETLFPKPGGGYKRTYEIISIHRGRDIFITCLLESRVPIPEVMKYTGHRSMTTLMGYLNLKTQVKNYTSELL
jgi:integrase